MSKEKHLTVIQGGALPAFLQSTIEEHAGRGVSHSAEDNIVPLIYVLQSGSPALKRSNPAYIEGASAGDLWKRNSAHKALVKGDEGIIFQPCHFSKVWIEWRPNRGGFVAAHKNRPADAKQVTKQHEGREVSAWVRPNGNELVETRQHAGFADGEPYVLSFSSTGHTVSRTWMQLMNQQLTPSGQIAASYSKKYLLTTVERTNTAGSWHVIKVQDAGWVDTIDEYNRGSKLFEAFDRGEKQAAAEEQEETNHEDVV